MNKLIQKYNNHIKKLTTLDKIVLIIFSVLFWGLIFAYNANAQTISNFSYTPNPLYLNNTVNLTADTTGELDPYFSIKFRINTDNSYVSECFEYATQPQTLLGSINTSGLVIGTYPVEIQYFEDSECIFFATGENAGEIEILEQNIILEEEVKRIADVLESLNYFILFFLTMILGFKIWNR